MLTLDMFGTWPHRGQVPVPAKRDGQQEAESEACPHRGQAQKQKTAPLIISSQMKTTAKAMQDTTTACQTIACWKGPLKGKGSDLRQWLKLAEARLADVHRQMNELRDETKTVEKRRVSLDVYFLRHRLQQSLRWRLAGGKHATWELVKPLLQTMNASEAQAYSEWNTRAEILNALEQVARYEVRNVQRLMEEQTAP